MTTYINPAVIVQSTLALTVAITCTEALRDFITAFHPGSPAKAAILRLLVAAFLVIFTILLVKYFPVCTEDDKSVTLQKQQNYNSTT